MPLIQSIEVCSVAVPLDRVTSFSNRTVTHRHYGLVKVHSAEGQTGIGFCYVGSSAGGLFTAAVEQLLAPVLLGQDSHAVEGLWARSAGLPLHRYLGAYELESVPAYASGGYYLDGKTPAMLGEEMASYVAMGFKAVKMKTGRLSPAAEEERLRAARDAVGPDVELMLDCNNGWADVTQALQYMRRFERYDPYFIEEPFSPDDVDSHARLAKLTRVPVATGEIGYGRWHHQELLGKQGAAILQTDAAVCGGITEWRRIAAMAAGHGAVMCPHWFHDLHAPLVAATPNARYVEFFWDDQVLNFRRLVDRQLQHRGGRVVLHQDPGLGFRFDEQAVGKLARWTRVDGSAA
jgi:L-alanine-DL-glutamate epimerase-like enolase superfamily enzyme